MFLRDGVFQGGDLWDFNSRKWFGGISCLDLGLFTLWGKVWGGPLEQL